MRSTYLVRAAAVAAALCGISLFSFPSFPGAGLFTVNPAAVDRTLKGDRLPLTAPTGSPMIGTPTSQRRQSREKIPIGCDGAFSPVASPLLANVFRRCTV